LDSAYFKTAASLRILLSTSVALIILVGAALLGLLLLMHEPCNKIGFCFLLFPFCILLCTAPFIVKGYSISDTEVRIVRFGKAKVFPIFGIESVEINPKAMAASFRLFGVSGFFCDIGFFMNNTLGKYHAYANNPKMSVVLSYGKKKQNSRSNS
jgi:hypothetical protein